MWVCGMRQGLLYTIETRPIDPRLPPSKLQDILAWCATGQHFGLEPDRAFKAAEGLVLKSIYEGIAWPRSRFVEDMEFLESSVLRK